jgi:nitronate monooxygenase
MDFLKKVKLIQGGMGVYVSNWRLARAVATASPGQTAGTVSGTALDMVYVRLLQLGDPGGHVQRALEAFDARFGTGIGQRIIDRFFIEGGKTPSAYFKNPTLQIARSVDGKSSFPVQNGHTGPIPLKLDDSVIELLIATGFAEVWLAKEGHDGNVFINFLHKIELPLIYAMYGAMLAGVDGIIVGAGNPEGLAAACTALAEHKEVVRGVPVLYAGPGEEFTISFDPQQVAGGALTREPLQRPAFLAIASLDALVAALAASETEPPDGFIIEHHTAGGHNAGPSGPMRRDAEGQPIYDERDEPNLAAIRAVGKPFWMAGGYGSREGLQRALAEGATGVQVGSVFAVSEDSGMKPEYRTAILKAIRSGVPDSDIVKTTMFSPTGFPFKVVQIEGTLSDDEVYESRNRTCDMGMLQQLGLSKPDDNGTRVLFQRCPAGPVDTYVDRRGLERNTEERRCLCNGLLSCVGLGQVRRSNLEFVEEPAIVTLGNHLDGIRHMSRQGQFPYFAREVVADMLA